MSTFKEANQIRLRLKMQLSQYMWYSGSVVMTDSDGYAVTILVSQLDNKVRKLISPVIDGVSVKTEVAV
jgi:hypothetical protein